MHISHTSSEFILCILTPPSPSVGLGSDFDGISSVPRGLEDVSKYPDLVRGSDGTVIFTI